MFLLPVLIESKRLSLWVQAPPPNAGVKDPQHPLQLTRGATTSGYRCGPVTRSSWHVGFANPQSHRQCLIDAVDHKTTLVGAEDDRESRQLCTQLVVV